MCQPLRPDIKFPRPIEDLRNQIFNNWQVSDGLLDKVVRYNKSARHYQWRSTCLKCGVYKWIGCSQLTHGKSKSCRGCAKGKYKFASVGELSASYWKAVLIKADLRHLEVSVTIQEAWELFLKQDRKCAYTKIPLKFGKSSRDSTATASCDRIDSTKGYIQGNIQWVHKQINEMKMSQSHDEFIKNCRLVAQNAKQHDPSQPSILSWV